MSLFRTLVRTAIAAAIRESATKAGERVYTDRWTLLDRTDEIPAVCVLTAGETAETFTVSPRAYKLTAQFAIELFVRRVEDEEIVQDLADELAAEVRGATDRAIACLTELDLPSGLDVTLHPDDCRYLETQFEFDNRGQTIIGGARLLYEVAWVESAEFPLDALELADWKRTFVAMLAQSDPSAAPLEAGFEHPQS